MARSISSGAHGGRHALGACTGRAEARPTRLRARCRCGSVAIQWACPPLALAIGLIASAGCEGGAAPAAGSIPQDDYDAQFEAQLRTVEEQQRESARQLQVSDQQQREMAEQIAATARQLERHESLLAATEAQSKRLEALLARWEEQARRYDALLERWEKAGEARPAPAHR